MSTTVEVSDRAALVALMRERLASFGFNFDDAALEVKPYRRDERINWDTHIVTISGYGVVGFTDGPL